jgi:hypothetical protein
MGKWLLLPLLFASLWLPVVHSKTSSFVSSPATPLCTWSLCTGATQVINSGANPKCCKNTKVSTSNTDPSCTKNDGLRVQVPCRIPTGCYCDADCYKYGDCCDNMVNICIGKPREELDLFSTPPLSPSLPPPSSNTTSPLCFAVPSISALSPLTGSTVGGYSLTITGTYFGTVGLVRVGGKTCSPTSWTATKVICTVPAGVGVQSVDITDTNVNSYGHLKYNTFVTFSFTYSAPTLVSLSPTSIATLGGSLTLTGTNFGNGNIFVA